MVQQAVHPDALTIFGATFDETMDDEIRVTVIATGFEKPAEQPKVTPKVVPPVEQQPKVAPAAVTPPTELGEQDIPQVEVEEDDPFDDIFKIFNSKRD